MSWRGAPSHPHRKRQDYGLWWTTPKWNVQFLLHQSASFTFKGRKNKKKKLFFFLFFQRVTASYLENGRKKKNMDMQHRGVEKTTEVKGQGGVNWEETWRTKKRREKKKKQTSTLGFISFSSGTMKVLNTHLLSFVLLFTFFSFFFPLFFSFFPDAYWEQCGFEAQKS